VSLRTTDKQIGSGKVMASYDKAMASLCVCEKSENCGYYDTWDEECREAFSKSLLQCNKFCPVECSQESFPINRVDFELGTDQFFVGYYLTNISRKFNITGMKDDQIEKRITQLFIYFDKFSTIEISQSASMSSTNLVANIGGLLGTVIHYIVLLT